MLLEEVIVVIKFSILFAKRLVADVGNRRSKYGFRLKKKDGVEMVFFSMFMLFGVVSMIIG